MQIHKTKTLQTKSCPKTTPNKTDSHTPSSPSKSSAKSSLKKPSRCAPNTKFATTTSSLPLKNQTSASSSISDTHSPNKPLPLYVHFCLLKESTQSIFRDDIFDKIGNPTFWSIQPNTENNLITVRSFLWPGYLAYLFTNRNVFGGVYFGNGIKNVDLPFYI